MVGRLSGLETNLHQKDFRKLKRVHPLGMNFNYLHPNAGSPVEFRTNDYLLLVWRGKVHKTAGPFCCGPKGPYTKLLVRKHLIGDISMREGILEQLGQTLGAQLSHDIAAAAANCIPADVQELSDILIGLSFGQELQDFTFPKGQAGFLTICYSAGRLFYRWGLL